MLYLICQPSNTSEFFFADTSTKTAGQHWTTTIHKAIAEFQDSCSDQLHRVFTWIDSGCPSNDADYQLVAAFESSDLSQDFEAGIATFRDRHPEYFV